MVSLLVEREAGVTRKPGSGQYLVNVWHERDEDGLGASHALVVCERCSKELMNGSCALNSPMLVMLLHRHECGATASS